MRFKGKKTGTGENRENREYEYGTLLVLCSLCFLLLAFSGIKPSMLEFDAERVTRNVRDATSEDLLDRITVYQDGMDPAALAITEAVLLRCGWERVEVQAHVAHRCAQRIPR